MKNIENVINYFSRQEIILWVCSVLLIVVSFCIFDREGYMALCASLIGVTALILNAKGNAAGQFLMIVFSLLYSFISFTFAYYGEMITYLGMSVPMSVISLVSWVKNPYDRNKSEVKINRISGKEYIFMWVMAVIVTIILFFVLRYFNTANIIPSTMSVTTSFIAAYLTFRRSPYFAIGYVANDIILMIMWSIASFYDIGYISVVICFAVFLANDMYGFISWREMEKRQMGDAV